MFRWLLHLTSVPFGQSFKIQRGKSASKTFPFIQFYGMAVKFNLKSFLENLLTLLLYPD